MHGRHRKAALDLLADEGFLDGHLLLKSKKVLCVVINTKSRNVQSYSMHRGNQIQNDVRKPSVHQLVFTLCSMRERLEPLKVTEAIRRVAVLLRTPTDEVAVLKKLAMWPLPCLSDLGEVLTKYQTFQTLDTAEQKRISNLISRGEMMPVNKRLFLKLGKIEFEDIENIKLVVINRKMSLKEAVEGCIKVKDRGNVLSLVGQLMGNMSSDSVKDIYGHIITDEFLDNYLGAVIGKSANLLGKNLTKICEEIEVEAPEDVTVKCKTTVLKSLTELKERQIEKVDVAVITSNGVGKRFGSVVDKVISVNKNCSFVILTDTDQACEELKVCMEEKIEQEPRKVFVKKDKAELKQGVEENIWYGLVFGLILNPPMKTMYDSVDDGLRNLVKCIANPQASLCVFSMYPKIPCNIIHDENHKVEYFGDENGIKILDTQLKKLKKLP